MSLILGGPTGRRFDPNPNSSLIAEWTSSFATLNSKGLTVDMEYANQYVTVAPVSFHFPVARVQRK
ncbi:hypothetical protein RvY_04487 [Ramazzottius varieornatus]|uniref:Uncharacterized protein n=1 Tax=Ramazzottius varieornatus TaxID=947166 RepID=A0A1D1URU3_RAMVA|nr:hypothetical protein RvY_04487 [Ramazzottius varieornatus]